MKRFIQSAFTTVTDWRSGGSSKPLSRFQSFERLWSILQSYEEKDVAEVEGDATIPALFNGLIQLLLEEEREVNDDGAAIAIIINDNSDQKPHGMFKWVVYAVSRLFQHMKTPLLAHMSVHKPVVKLISEWNTENLSVDEKLGCIYLINSLILKLKEEPLFIRLFFRDGAEGTSSPLSAPTNTPSSPSYLSPSEFHIPALSVGYGPGRDFVIFKALERLYRDCGGDARLLEQIRRSLLSCLAINDSADDYMAEYYAEQHDFMNMMVEELVEKYFNTTQEMSFAVMQEYLKHVAFCNSLTKLERREQFCHNLVRQINERFFQKILSYSLLSSNPTEANLHTILIRETLSQIDSPALTAHLVSLLLSDKPDFRLEAMDAIEPIDRSIQDILLDRIRFNAPVFGTYDSDDEIIEAAELREQLAANTLRLFSTLLSIESETSVICERLLFGQWPPAFDQDEFIDASLDEFLSKISGVPQLKSKDENNNGDTVVLSSLQDYRRVVKRKLVNYKHRLHQFEFQPKSEGTAHEKEFLRIIFDNLQHLFELNIDSALFLLDIILKITQIPSLEVHNYLIHMKPAPGFSCLSAILSKLLEDASNFLEDKFFAAELNKLYVSLCGSNVECNIKLQSSSTRQLQGVILLHEFCKNLTANLETVHAELTEHGGDSKLFVSHTSTVTEVLWNTMSDQLQSSTQPLETSVRSSVVDTNKTVDDVLREEGKVTVFFKPAGDVPILKLKKFRFNQSYNFAYVLNYLRKQLHFEDSDPLFIFVNDSFQPSPDDILANIYRVRFISSVIVVW